MYNRESINFLSKRLYLALLPLLFLIGLSLVRLAIGVTNPIDEGDGGNTMCSGNSIICNSNGDPPAP